MPVSKSKKVREPKVNERAILAAKDVLKRLRLKKLYLVRDGYLCKPSVWGENGKHSLWESLPSNGDLQDHVDAVEECCSVCADGALLLSVARLFDNVPMKDIKCSFIWAGSEGASTLRNLLTPVIDEKTLNLLEVAFEGKEMDWSNLTKEEIKAALKFGKRFRSLEGIVRGGMKNIIANGGHFKP
jgi:hypothetical protein